MITRGIDANGDWEWGNGFGSYRTEQQAVMQNIATKIREWYGDCFFEMGAGIDWLNRLAKISPDILRQELTALILKCDGVVDAEVTDAILVNRTYTIQYSVTTIYSRSAQTQVANVTI